MRGIVQTQTYRRVRHAGRLRLVRQVESEQKLWLKGQLDDPVPPVRPLPSVLVEGAYADISTDNQVNRYVSTRDQVVNTTEKIERLRLRRLARRAKLLLQQVMFE